ncbi:L,D-transpeptidase family protein [Pontibacter ruber]|uniref:Murein L,D-transpeptidase n=1 Tax=Pontibacter ruber TaxID=1343895 RepID=A0ABW5CV87_9BACT|nr:L,D-transpeptidase family protein [Pontibacter ruber]
MLLVPDYAVRMQEAIVYYQQLATQPWKPVPGRPLLKSGTTSPRVQQLQENLILLGDLPHELAGTDEVYTSEVAAAVANFQERHGLIADSIYGPKTAAAMSVPPARRLVQLQNSLSRWSATSRGLEPPYLIVNIPEYALRLVDSSNVILETRTIIGKPDLPTRSVRTAVHTIIVNPSWIIPRSIASKEILPILKRNPGYLDKRDMRLFKPTILGGYVRVNPWQINWAKVTPHNFNYRIVQKPGEQNELGRIKFLFNTRVDQYLHDTKNRQLFDLEYRALSHGCIRVQHPEELAKYLLQERSGYSAKRVERLLTSKKPEQNIRLKKPTPLLITYLTAWIDNRDRIQFRDDIYGYDKAPPLTRQE